MKKILTEEEKSVLREKRRIYLKLTNNRVSKKYEKTKKGFLMRAYRNMESRIKGIQKKKAHLYIGKCLMSREDFYTWSLNNKDFHNLFEKWEKSSYNRKLTPSVDRINPDIGYDLTNVRWVTHSENSKNITIHLKTLELKGEVKSEIEWAALYKISIGALRARLKSGWSVEKAITTPLNHCKKD